MSESFVMDYPIGTVQLWTQYEYIDENLDILNFVDHASTSSRLQKESTIKLGAHWRYSTNYAVQAMVFSRSAVVSRALEPRRVDGDQQGVSISLQRLFPQSNSALQIKFNHFDVDTLSIEKYQQGSLVLGEDIVLLDPDTLQPLPIVALDIQESGGEISYLKKFPMPAATTEYSLTYRYSNIQPNVESVLFNVTDTTFLNSIVGGQVVGDIIERFRNTMPQNSNWQEHIFSASLTYSKPVASAWSIACSLQAYGIRRKNYIEGNNEDQITSNFVLNSYLYWSPAPAVSVYLNGRISSNYVAGSDPGVYNRRNAHLFDNYYGIIALGAAYRF